MAAVPANQEGTGKEGADPNNGPYARHEPQVQ